MRDVSYRISKNGDVLTLIFKDCGMYQVRELADRIGSITGQRCPLHNKKDEWYFSFKVRCANEEE